MWPVPCCGDRCQHRELLEQFEAMILVTVTRLYGLVRLDPCSGGVTIPAGTA